MSAAKWSMLSALLLLIMMLAGTLLNQMPLSPAMIYFALDERLGPGAANAL